MAYTQTPYMDHTHPDAFVDWARREPEPRHNATKECPRCRGFGGWNLELNSYPMHGQADTSENRHRFSHFRTMCSHCNGWGYVSPEETCAGHEWILEKNLGNCFSRYRCASCKVTHDVDSSG